VRGFRPERLLPLACIGGAVILTASQFLDIFELNAAGPTARALIDSADQHWYAMAVLGIFAGCATVAAVASGSKPLAASVAAAGGAALLLFLLIDLPDAGKTGNISDPTLSFVTAKADPQGGFWLELIGALILTVCGGALATLSPDQLRDLRPRRRRGRRPARPRAGAAAPDTNPGERATEPGAARARKPSRSADAG
jgi:hypothetical protein